MSEFKKVKLKITIEHETKIPMHWNEEDIHFALVENNCRTNLISEIYDEMQVQIQQKKEKDNPRNEDSSI